VAIRFRICSRSFTPGSLILTAKWRKRPLSYPLWERAMRAKNRGHGLGVPARSHKYCADGCHCL